MLLSLDIAKTKFHNFIFSPNQINTLAIDCVNIGLAVCIVFLPNSCRFVHCVSTLPFSYLEVTIHYNNHIVGFHLIEVSQENKNSK